MLTGPSASPIVVRLSRITPALGLIALVSCGGLPGSAPEGIPDWVWNVPYDDDFFYGRGSYAHSLYQEDNEKNARVARVVVLVDAKAEHRRLRRCLVNIAVD